MIRLNENLVTAVTRSFNRVPLLRRAAESILSQRFDRLTWQIVNNGGEREPVETVAEWARQNGAVVEVIHMDQPTGIWAAANAGVQTAQTPFLILHDDDDSWSPEFLERTIGFLKAYPGFAGVSTQCTCIHEVVSGEAITETNRFVLNADFQSCQLGDMAVLNRIVPIAFLYRASLHGEIGWFRDDLPVMGDWEFCLRVLTRHEIGVIPEPLANYHHRASVEDPSDPNGNTVIARGNAHAMTDALIRNGFLRDDLDRGTFGLGAMLALARSMLRSQELDRFALFATRDELAQTFSDTEHRLSQEIEQIADKLSERTIGQAESMLDVMDGLKGQIGTRLAELALNQARTAEELARLSAGLDDLASISTDIRSRIQQLEERQAQNWLTRMRTHR